MTTNASNRAFLLFLVVQRARKCLDFTATVYIVDFIVCIFYKTFPVSWEWWACRIVSVMVMASLGEYICYKREMSEIPIYQQYQQIDQRHTNQLQQPSARTSAAAAAAAANPSTSASIVPSVEPTSLRSLVMGEEADMPAAIQKAQPRHHPAKTPKTQD